MPNAEKSLKGLAVAMMAVSFLGFIDASYLTITRITNVNVPCTLTHACDLVLHSQYSTLLGIPVVVIGAVYYLTIFFGTYVFLEYRSRLYFKYTAALTTFGFLFSVWFVYAQLELLHAICQYCMVSAGTSTMLFALGITTIAILRTDGSATRPSTIK